METSCKQEQLDKIEKREEPEASLMTLPVEMRERIFTYLNQTDLLFLRQVCDRLRWESELFGKFSVVMKSVSKLASTQIPFPNLYRLSIDNDQMDLPWGDCETDNVKYVAFDSISYPTFSRLGQLPMIEEAVLGANVFQRTVPSLEWGLKTLHIDFHVAPNQTEGFMLDNFDSLFIQSFQHLEELNVNMCNPCFPNLQRQYTSRILRFIAKHHSSLKRLEVILEAEPCVPPHYTLTPQALRPGLNPQELLNLAKVQLDTLVVNVTEMACPQCSLWQQLIRQQKCLKSLLVGVYYAQKLPTVFFCPSERNTFQVLKSLSLHLWGLAGFYSFDCRYLSDAANLRFLEICRYCIPRTHLSNPEIVNLECLPEGICSFHLVGLLIHSNNVSVIFSQLPTLAQLVLVECGSGLETGVQLSDSKLFKEHPTLTTAMVDFNAAAVEKEESLWLISDCLQRLGLDHRYFCEVFFSHNQRFWIGNRDRLLSPDENETINHYYDYSCSVLQAVESVWGH